MRDDVRFRMWLRLSAETLREIRETSHEIQEMSREIRETCGLTEPHESPRETRSIMREILSPEEVRHLEISEGRWFLPGTPP